ncbi:MAG: EAL domain-containing protein [Casimicrobiaceae bacterium]|nr:EAL domain-containing protein [Casimicrobiaceae bacterium]
MLDTVLRMVEGAADWRSALEQFPLVAYAVDDEGCFAWLNVEAQRLFERPGESLLGRPYFERVHPDDREGALQRYKKLRSQQVRAYRVDVRYLDAYDKPLWLRVAIQRIDGQAGLERPLYLAIAQAIVDVEAKHGVLERSERQLRLALEASRAGAWDWDLLTDVVEYSHGFMKLLRYPGGDFHVDFVFRERLHEDDRERVTAAVRASIASDTEFDETYRLLCFDGCYRWFHARGRAVYDSSGRPVRFSGVLFDWEQQHSLHEALEQSERRMRYLAFHDPLTGLNNRRGWREALEQRLAQLAPRRCRLAVLFVDLDGFKHVNDSLGHAVGDLFLIEAAARMRQILGARADLARLGGDEFVAHVEVQDCLEGVLGLARTLIRVIAAPWRLGSGIELMLGASVGVAVYPEHGEAAEELLAAADAALYAAKAAGRNQVRLFDAELRRAADRRVAVEVRLRRALQEGRLRLAYQPMRAAASSRWFAVEALSRWNDPELGSVPPAQFVPVAEAAGLMPELGRWVREQAFADLARWRAEAGVEFGLALNFSAQELLTSEAVDHVAQLLERYGLPPQLLTFEITESALIDTLSPARLHAEQLRALGLRLAIDDFGTGYSSLGLLKRIRVDQIKIDRSFVSGVDQHEDDRAICTAMVSMARQLGLEVVAEGVERSTQREALNALGCHLFQGFIDGGEPIEADRVLRRWAENAE